MCPYWPLIHVRKSNRENEGRDFGEFSDQNYKYVWIKDLETTQVIWQWVVNLNQKYTFVPL